MDQPLYPLVFEPILKRLIWGGRRLETVLHKKLGPGSDYAESWEISDHGQDVSRVADGPLAGTLLRDLVKHRGRALLGPALGDRDQFPLLVKFIDAHQVLSVQVHPDDERGHRLAGDNGKTETWVVVHAEPDSVIYAGLRAGVGSDQFARAIESGQVEPLLHRFPARPGDCIFIPAGTVHAIGAGVLLAEVQQMSDATFRIFDWGRVGPDGRPRKLHIAESLESTDYQAGPVEPLAPQAEPISGGTRERLSRCAHFALERLRFSGRVRVGSVERFTILVALAGAVEVRHGPNRYPLGFGQTCLLPASLGPCEVAADEGEACLLTCVVP
jgi:mannose-6-phosphate isomerase